MMPFQDCTFWSLHVDATSCEVCREVQEVNCEIGGCSQLYTWTQALGRDALSRRFDSACCQCS